MGTKLIQVASIVCVVSLLSIVAISIIIMFVRQRFFPKQPRHNNDIVIGFFHPNCSSGGGGERVLWKMIQALSELIENHGMHMRIVIYTIDKPQSSYRQSLVSHVSSRFSISIPDKLELKFVHINNGNNGIMDSTSQEKRSMISQTLETLKLSWNCLTQLTPDIYIDTTGCAFTFIIARIAGCKIGAYVHYPTISKDMLALVWQRRPSYNNNSKITSNTLYSYIKLLYYTLFAICYGIVGSLASLVMVNSTWTYNHIHSLWRFSSKQHIVFPPCDTNDLSALSLDDRKNNIIISIGQFRPEKDHELQIRSFSLLLQMLKQDGIDNINPKLILIGSCRSKVDDDRVQYLRDYTKRYNIADNVEFLINQPYSILKSYLSQATIGLHTMWNEHFGISVVEMMAAGVVTIAHNSGGPKSDIIQNNSTGYLATSEQEYSKHMKDVLCNEIHDKEINMDIRRNARESSMRFSDQVFNESFKEVLLSSGILNK